MVLVCPVLKNRFYCCKFVFSWRKISVWFASISRPSRFRFEIERCGYRWFFSPGIFCLWTEVVMMEKRQKFFSLFSSPELEMSTPLFEFASSHCRCDTRCRRKHHRRSNNVRCFGSVKKYRAWKRVSRGGNGNFSTSAELTLSLVRIRFLSSFLKPGPTIDFVVGVESLRQCCSSCSWQNTVPGFLRNRFFSGLLFGTMKLLPVLFLFERGTSTVWSFVVKHDTFKIRSLRISSDSCRSSSLWSWDNSRPPHATVISQTSVTEFIGWGLGEGLSIVRDVMRDLQKQFERWSMCRRPMQ